MTSAKFSGFLTPSPPCQHFGPNHSIKIKQPVKEDGRGGKAATYGDPHIQVRRDGAEDGEKEPLQKVPRQFGRIAITR